MAEEEQASLAEILAAADEGGIPVIMGGTEVHSIEEVPERLRDVPLDGEAHVVTGDYSDEELPEWLRDRLICYVIGDEHQPITRAIIGDRDVRYDDQTGAPLRPTD